MSNRKPDPLKIVLPGARILSDIITEDGTRLVTHACGEQAPVTANVPLRAQLSVIDHTIRLPEDAELLRRAVVNAASLKYWHPRWAAVKDLFRLGSDAAQALCRQVGVDPFERVKR